jgi:hypothetical protein
MRLTLTLDDWTDKDERRFQRTKRKLLLARLTERQSDYDIATYSCPSVLRRDTVSGTRLCEA